MVVKLKSDQAEKGLATDRHGYTRIQGTGVIRVHPCESVAENGVSAFCGSAERAEITAPLSALELDRFLKTPRLGVSAVK
jgi:hypothetical protein